MSTTQIPEVPVVGGDLSMPNLGTTDIPADRGVVVDPNNDFAIALPATGQPPQGALGIVMEPIRPGATGRVRRLGVKRAFADGAIPRGARVQLSSVAGREGYVRLAQGAGSVGTALSSAADGEAVAVDMLVVNP